MHSKKTLIRVLIRTLYAGGFIFLIAGLLLSTLSTTALASGTPALDLAASPTSQETPPNCYCITPTPGRTGPAPTKTGTPATPKPTRPPLNFNLSSICGYTYDNYELWKVANNTGSDAKFTWRVVGSNENGSGTVAAHGSTYFTTSAGLKTVRLYIGDQLVDTESCLSPCKKELQLSYACTSEGLAWQVTNANSFGVDYTVRVDGKAAGKGALKANSSITILKTSSGAHTVEVTWTDTRPGTHTVALSSPPNSCAETVSTDTPTPTFTSTLPVVTETVTPTVTETLPVVTETVTPTATETAPGEFIPTHTATPTATVTHTATVTLPVETSTFTVTPTTTLTPSGGFVSTVTSTPTATRTVTATATLTPSGGFIPTVTRIVTLPPPVVTVTSTPVLIPVTGADLTRPIAASSLGLFAGLFTNVGLFTLGLALALTGITSQVKD